MRTYAAKLDTISRIITICVTGLVGITMYYAGRKGLAEPWIWVVIIVLGGCYFFMPTSYAVDNEAIEINRPINTILIPVNEVLSAERISVSDLGFGFRIGSGGFMGYLGLFRYPSIGWVRMHCTDRSRMVLIKRERKQYIISPDEPDAFVDDVNALILNKTSRN